MSEVTDPDLLKQLNAAPPDAPKPEENVFLRGGRGVARGAAGIASSVGDVLPSFGPTNPERGKALREFATAPTEGVESAGQFAGSVVPFMVAPEVAGARAAMAIAPYVGRLAPSLVRIANSAIKGGAAGGAEPTQSGTAGSHLENAKRGAAMGGGLGLAGALMSTPIGRSLARHAAVHGQAATIAMVMRYAGLPAHMLWAPWTAYRAIRDYSPLTSLAGRAGPLVRRGAAPAGAASAGDEPSRSKGEVTDPDLLKKLNEPETREPTREEPPSVNRSRKGDLARIREERHER